MVLTTGKPLNSALKYYRVKQFSMSGLKLRSPVHFMLDFDGTITMKDTMSILARAPAYRDLRLHGANDRGSTERQWSSFGKAYMEDYRAHTAVYTPKAENRGRVQGVRDWLASLEGVEEGSAKRVEQSEFFRGVIAQDVHKAAVNALENKELQLRHGCRELMQRVLFNASQRTSNGLTIISVNWSRKFIKSAIWPETQGADNTRDCDAPTTISNEIDILANELEGLGNPAGSSGRFCAGQSEVVRTSADKWHHMDNISVPEIRGPPPLLVFIGDSPTDFECVLDADVGICMRDQPMGSGQSELAALFQRMGVPVLHVSESCADVDGKSLWWARDFAEIGACLVP